MKDAYTTDIDDETAGWFRSTADTPELIVAFGGLINNGFLGIPPFEFVNLIDQLPVTKVFVRDLDQSWYHRGARGLGDSLSEMAEGLRPLIEGRRRVVFTGHSSGGYAALVLGSLLRVHCIVATSPQTFISHRLRWWHNDDRWPHEIRHTYGSPHLDRSLLDAKPHLRRASSSDVRIYYSQRHNWDPPHAERLRKLPNVTLHRFNEPTHSIAKYMRDQGTLLPVLRESLGVGE